MSDVEASNALVTVVRFYSEALARTTAERDQLSATLKTILQKAEEQKNVRTNLVDVDPERDRVIDAALRVLKNRKRLGEDGDALTALFDAVVDYERTRDPVDRMEPHPARPGPVRGAPTDSAPDVPG